MTIVSASIDNPQDAAIFPDEVPLSHRRPFLRNARGSRVDFHSPSIFSAHLFTPPRVTERREELRPKLYRPPSEIMLVPESSEFDRSRFSNVCTDPSPCSINLLLCGSRAVLYRLAPGFSQYHSCDQLFGPLH